MHRRIFTITGCGYGTVFVCSQATLSCKYRRRGFVCKGIITVQVINIIRNGTLIAAFPMDMILKKGWFMDRKKVREKLLKLEMCESYVIKIYEKSFSEIHNADILNQIKNICQDHIEHKENLYLLCEELQESIVSEHPDVHIPYLKDIVFGSGVNKILQSLLADEKIMNNLYAELFNLDLSEDVYAQIENNYDDEQDHVSYIEEILLKKNEGSKMMKGQKE